MLSCPGVGAAGKLEPRETKSQRQRETDMEGGEGESTHILSPSPSPAHAHMCTDEHTHMPPSLLAPPLSLAHTLAGGCLYLK